MNLSDAVLALGALAHESRLELFRLLVKRGPEGYAPGDLADKLGIPGPTLSFHLKELSRAALIEARKEGRFIYYRPDFDRVNDVMGFLTQHCCSLAGGECGDCPPSKSAKPKPKRLKSRT